MGEELKEERTSLKAMRVENQQIKEELSDLKNEKEAIERVRKNGVDDILYSGRGYALGGYDVYMFFFVFVRLY